ncbi:MAG: DUF4147 domain-containing protein [Candidatus Promineifilaceae bacterium]|nr:DUF4147 domain-containing protein [Candidatus Promineifilaceae bacterium]
MTLHFENRHDHVQSIIEAALDAADPAGAVRRHLRRDGRQLLIGEHRYDLDRGRVFLIAAGKAALSMGRTALDILQDELAAGVIITKQTEPGQPRRYTATVGGRAAVAVYEASHPVSDESSVRATAAAIDLLEETAPGDLVLCLISGGASALLTQPHIALEQWQRLTQALLESGCTINELNSVRKQLDNVKGGGLARLAAPAATVSLILSDVVGNPLDVIGSGPTAANPESPAEALTVLHRYHIAGVLIPEVWKSVIDRLTNPRSVTSLARFEELEVENVIIGDVHIAANAAADAARQLGFDDRFLTAHLQGEAREVGRVAAALARDAPTGACLLLGGETTVTVHGEGTGGRNQELALSAAISLADAHELALATFATDGEDGVTDAAGAIVTGQTAPRAEAAGLNPQEYLEENDSYNFFLNLEKETGRDYLIRTGPTGTNVNDLLIILSYEQ